MAKTVWCVFERLPHEKCPALSAVCASAEVAEEMCEMARREKEADGEPESELTITPWTVLDRQVRKIDRADQISHVLDPMRGALAYPSANGADGMEDDGEDASPRTRRKPRRAKKA
jgi:hypothetical protein